MTRIWCEFRAHPSILDDDSLTGLKMRIELRALAREATSQGGGVQVLCHCGVMEYAVDPEWRTE